MNGTEVLLQPPTWINEQFLTRVVRFCISDKDVKFNISRNNYRVVETNSTNFAFILKVPSTATPINEDNSFENEISIYSCVLDEMHRLLYRTGENIQLGPRVIYYTSESNAVIVLEDLAKYTAPKTVMNVDKTLAVVLKLARWHATSLYMANENRKVSSFASSSVFNKKYNDDLTFMFENYQYFANEVQKWQGFEVNSDRLKNLESSFCTKGKYIFTGQPNGFNVLNHGDLNFKNVLTKSDGERNDVVFVDFQNFVWASLAIDLLYVLYLVASSEVRQRFRSELITFYYNEFTKTLKGIGHWPKPPSMLDLQNELQKHGFLEVVIAVCYLPFLCSDCSNQNVIDDTSSAENIRNVATTNNNIENVRKVAFSNPEFIAIIKNLLPYFLTKGFLNF